jgi:L-fuconolactonase
MFGSDWPVASLAADYATVIDTAAALIAGLSTDEQAHVWQHTAEHWYRLPAQLPT